MIIGAAQIKIHIPWSHSLKEKRMVVKSLIAKVDNKFNVSIAEVEEQDIHQIAVIGIACVTSSGIQAQRIINTVIDYIETITEAEIIDIQREIR